MDQATLLRIADAIVHDDLLLPSDKQALHGAMQAWLGGASWSEAFGRPDSAAARRARRDQLIRDYAGLLPERGRSAAVAAEAARVMQRRRGASPTMAAAHKVMALPETERHFLRIIKKSDI